MTGEKLQKILARAGLGSRRKLEASIAEGNVVVNGKKAKLGDRATEADTIEFNGRRVRFAKNTQRVIAYNKPEGEICTLKDEKGRRTVFESLPRIQGQRWINVGRLDINTTGLMLFTTDGELANKLMHPSSEIDREYRVRVFGEVTPEMEKALVTGVELEDGPAKFSDLMRDNDNEGHNRWYTVCLMEGRNREVRRLWESQELKVNRLKRVRYGPIFLESYVRPGQWIDLSVDQVKSLYETADLKTPEIYQSKPAERVKAERQEHKLRARGGHSSKVRRDKPW